MLYKTLTVQREDYILIISLSSLTNYQGKISILSDELTELCREVDLDQEIRVIILTGDGEKSFSIETDLGGVVSGEIGKQQIRFLSIAEPIAQISKPVIAAINGDAIGLGLELALACDIRIATEICYFGLPHVKSGLIPWDGGTQRLSRLVGKGKALELILTGETIGAPEACRIGLLNKVVPTNDLMKTVMAMAREMASKGPVALRYTKEAIQKGMDLTLEQGLRLEADLYLLIHTTQDRTEGIQAFREKRTPKFEGR
jgi:enoyl-CoA hydratase/carnithine racemase